jgi:HAD superfamily hydrolase (TIGR01509 family)
VVFDCDGTLADTEPLSAAAWRRTLAARGVVATDADFDAIIGHAWPRGFEHFSARADLGDPDAFRADLRAVATQIYADGLSLFPDAVATLRALVAAGVPVAVASSSHRAHVLRCLEREDLVPLVTAVIGADDVERHKPDPEPYLAAAAALGVASAGCTTIEDTVTGITSARAAGTFTVAVTRGTIAPEALSIADRVVPRIGLDVLVPPPGWRSPRRPGPSARGSHPPAADPRTLGRHRGP